MIMVQMKMVQKNMDGTNEDGTEKTLQTTLQILIQVDLHNSHCLSNGSYWKIKTCSIVSPRKSLLWFH